MLQISDKLLRRVTTTMLGIDFKRHKTTSFTLSISLADKGVEFFHLDTLLEGKKCFSKNRRIPLPAEMVNNHLLLAPLLEDTSAEEF